MNRRILPGLFAAALLVGLTSGPASAVTCTPTGFFRDTINMTAALINPPNSAAAVPVNATGCNIGIYYDAGSSNVVAGEIFGANYFGVVVNGDASNVNVDIAEGAKIHDIGETPHNGDQHGIGAYYRAFFATGSASGTIKGATISAYQKGGIVVNGQGSNVTISDSSVTGDGHVNFIAQNGIQIGYGATASVMRNTVSGNSFIGFPGDGSASGGILAVGGPGYGTCPDGNDCPYTVKLNAMQNTLRNNDVGVYLSNIRADFSAPDTATNNKAVNNVISDDLCYNASYQAGVSDQGNNDKIISNTISGNGYRSCATGFVVDADPSFTNRSKVHATK